MFGRRPSLPRALAAALLVLPACKPKEPVGPDEAEAEAAGKAAVAAAPVSDVARPSQMLPRGVAMLAVGKSPTRLAAALGRDGLVEALGPGYEALAGTAKQAFGFDPFDPSAYADVGLDPEGPVGFARLDPAQRVVAVFGTIADADELAGTVKSVAAEHGADLEEQAVGDAKVMRKKGDAAAPAVVVRGSLAVLVIPMGDAPTVDWAERLATVPPEESLSRARGYRRAMGSFPDGDVLVFVEPASLGVHPIAAAAEGDEGEGDGEAVAEGATPPPSGSDRAAAHDELLQRTFSGAEGIGLRLSAKKSGVFVEGRVALGADAFLASLLHNVPGRAALASAGSGEPLLLVSGGLDPAAAQEWASLAMSAAGTSWDQVKAKLKEDADVDLDRDLVPLLAGEAGMMITLDRPLDFAKPDLPATIGLAIHAKVEDPAAAKALLQKLDASAGKLGTMLVPDGDRFVADVPGWRKVWVEIAGDDLLVATDGQLGIRMARETRGLMARNTDPPEAWAAMMMPDRALVVAHDARFFALTMQGVPQVEMAMVESPELADVPMSRKAKAKQKEIDAVDEKLKKAQDAIVGKQLKRLDDAIAPLGTTVLTAAMDDRGIDLLGAQLIRGESLGSVLGTLGRAVTGGPVEATDPEVQALVDQRMKLGEELRAIREADAARLKGRKPRASKAGAGSAPKASKAKPADGAAK